MASHDLVVVKQCKLIRETEQAILIGNANVPLHSQGSKGKTWIPKIFISSPFPFDNPGDIADIEMKRWVAEQNHLKYEKV